MSDMSINQVLAQMRVVAAKAQSRGVLPADDVQAAQGAKGTEFSSLLKNSINAVNEMQQTSGDMKKRFEMGAPDVNLVDVTIASEKAKVAFTAMTEVRNKLVQAYKEVMNMPI